MAEETVVSLHGMWASPFSKCVEIALKTKGIPFEFVEEDLRNKSPSLLNYNPVHKKVPVLVHNGKPVAESLVILEYIDETWKAGPKLLPEDPYRKAQVRFWASYLQQHLFMTMSDVVKSDGEAQEKAIEEWFAKLQIFEDGIKKLFPDRAPCFDCSDDNLGMLDIVLCSLFGPHKVQEEVLGITIIDSEKNPVLFTWLKSMNELPLVKELTPPHEKLVAVFHFFRNYALNSGAASPL